MDFPLELEGYLREVFDAIGREDMEKLHASCMDAAHDLGDFIDKNRESIESYLKYRESDAYINSPAGKMKEMLSAFYKSAGYYDVFIPNLKVLSPAYCEYLDQMEEANTVFLERYPGVKA